jgi:hypothetical protein
MKFYFLSILLLCPTPLILISPSTATASICDYSLGNASSRQFISVNLCSIQHKPSLRTNFTYNLGRERIEAQANCRNHTWLTYPERESHRPQSVATLNMMKIVCTAPSFNEGIGIGVVFDPPSKVRKIPNGQIVCTIHDVTAIALVGGVTGGGEWIRTSACGGGVIHQSQVRSN